MLLKIITSLYDRKPVDASVFFIPPHTPFVHIRSPHFVKRVKSVVCVCWTITRHFTVWYATDRARRRLLIHPAESGMNFKRAKKTMHNNTHIIIMNHHETQHHTHHVLVRHHTSNIFLINYNTVISKHTVELLKRQSFMKSSIIAYFAILMLALTILYNRRNSPRNHIEAEDNNKRVLQQSHRQARLRSHLRSHRHRHQTPRHSNEYADESPRRVINVIIRSTFTHAREVVLETT